MASLLYGTSIWLSPPATALTVSLERRGMIGIRLNSLSCVTPTHTAPTKHQKKRLILSTQVQRNALAQAVKVVIGDKDGFPQSTGWLPNDSAYAELPAPNTDAIPVPPAEGTSTQTCKLQPITGGKAGILGYTCSCNTGPTPSPVTTSGTVSCPTATAA